MTAQPTFRESVFNRRMLACGLLGFASGLPFYYLGLLPLWLQEQGLGLATLGYVTLVRTPYAWKFLWSPLLDRYAVPGFGRFRGWMIVTQLGLVLLIGSFALLGEPPSLDLVVPLGIALALFGATQDIALDAYRRELLPDEELALGNSLWVNTYRLAGFVPGSLALVVASRVSWHAAHLVVAGCMLASVFASVFAPQLPAQPSSPKRVWDAIKGPFLEFFSRGDLADAFKLLGFLFLYKLGDNLSTALVSPFYRDVGFSLEDIAAVVKPVSVVSMIVGSVIGGLWIVKVGIHRALWVFGVVQMLSILGFAALAEIGPDIRALVATVTFEYLGIGLATSAFIAFLSRATSRRFSATQYALFSSFVSLPGILVGAIAGHLIEALGYTLFFLLCVVLSIPGMALLPFVAPWHEKPTAPK